MQDNAKRNRNVNRDMDMTKRRIHARNVSEDCIRKEGKVYVNGVEGKKFQMKDKMDVKNVQLERTNHLDNHVCHVYQDIITVSKRRNVWDVQKDGINLNEDNLNVTNAPKECFRVYERMHVLIRIQN